MVWVCQVFCNLATAKRYQHEKWGGRGLRAPGEVGEQDLLQVCDWLDFLQVEQPGDIYTSIEGPLLLRRRGSEGMVLEAPLLESLRNTEWLINSF